MATNKAKAPSKSKKPARSRTTSKAPPAPKMPRWQRAPQDLTELFAKLQDGLPPEAEKRKMFGYPCSFVNGQMFAGLHQTNMVLRLGEKERTEFLRMAGAAVFEPLPGRVMKEYVVVPPALRADDRELFRWMVKAFTFARSLPPKVKKSS